MRILLATAVAIAPLMAVAGAQAQVVIDDERTTPIATSTANSGAAADITIESGGSVELESGVAVTVDSNNDLDIDSGGSVLMNDAADGATGVLVEGGNSGAVTIGGAISLTDSVDTDDYEDEDEDGDLDGPFAVGSDRYGVRLTGPGAYDGDIILESTSAVIVEGNDSTAVSIETALDGTLRTLGNIGVLGDNVYGVRVTGDVSGDIDMAGGVTATGDGATGVSIESDVGGTLKLHSTVTATGYRYTAVPPSRPTTGEVNDDNLYLEDLDEDDLLQGGPAVAVAGDVAGGILLDRGPAYESGGPEGDDDGDDVKNGDEDDDGDGTKNSEDSDRDGDGIPDASETTPTITSIGAAPALQVGSADRAVAIGAVGEGDDAYGLINRGTIAGNGLYSGISATAVEIGVAGGQAVSIEGGLRNEGSISAAARDAASTAIAIRSGASVPSVVNLSTIESLGASDERQEITAVLIDQGSNVSTINNDGDIRAGFTGNHGDVAAIRDLSGNVTSLVNSGLITATFTESPDDDSEVDGSAVAIDLSANTSGVTIRQFGQTDEGDVDSDGDGTPNATDDDDDGDGIPDSEDNDDFDDDNDGVYDADEPFIIGEIRLGAGADTLNVENGSIIGDISFGTGADALNISGGASVSGKITDADGQLDIDVSDGVLFATQTSSTNISSLDVGGDGTLLFNVDPEAGTAGGFNVSGAANVADGAALGVRFASLLTEPERFTLLEAGTLNVGELDQTLLEDNSPYLYVVEAGVDQAQGQLYVDARRRTAEEADLIAVEASAFDAVYEALGDNETLQNLFLTRTNRDDFIDVYEQMLPDHSGGPLMSLSAGVDAVTRALTGRNASAAPGETSAWLQEINFYADKDKTDSYGFRSEGFGVAGGVEKGTSMGAFGITAAFTSSDIEDPESEAEEILSANLLELGLYWRAQGQYWTTWARAAGGYASFSADRSLVAEGVYLNNTSDWHGWTAAAAGGASYERHFGRLNVRPEVYAEYFHLSEEARSEVGGGDGFDLDIDERDSHIFSAVAAMNIGYGFGRDGWIRPEVRIGYRQNLSVDAGETIARFASGGPDFILSPDAIEGGGPILGFRLNVGNELGMVSLTGDAELLEDYVRYSLLLRASFRF